MHVFLLGTNMRFETSTCKGFTSLTRLTFQIPSFKAKAFFTKTCDMNVKHRSDLTLFCCTIIAFAQYSKGPPYSYKYDITKVKPQLLPFPLSNHQNFLTPYIMGISGYPPPPPKDASPQRKKALLRDYYITTTIPL